VYGLAKLDFEASKMRFFFVEGSLALCGLVSAYSGEGGMLSPCSSVVGRVTDDLFSMHGGNNIHCCQRTPRCIPGSVR